jgi:hypothetical protein
MTVFDEHLRTVLRRVLFEVAQLSIFNEGCSNPRINRELAAKALTYWC